MENLLKQIAHCVIVGHIDEKAAHPPEMRGEPGVRELVTQAIEESGDADRILKQGLLAGMEVVGQKFRDNEYFIPDVLASCQCMRLGSQLLKPLLGAESSTPMGKFIIGTVEGDLHDIGKTLVSIMLEGAGYQIIDLGINAKPEKFIEAARQHPGAPIGMSALLSTTMVNMGKTIEALKGADLPGPLITVIGGAPVTKKFAQEIGATGYAPDAGSSVEIIGELLKVHAA